MDKPDTISVDLSSPDFHGFMWDVTLDGDRVDQAIVASRLHGYVERYQTDESGSIDAELGAETLYGDVDYERIVNAEDLE